MSVLSAGTGKGGGSFGFDLGGGQAPIQGGLPFSNAGGQAGGSLSTLFPNYPGSAQLGGDYTAAYNAALALNQQNYQNILKGYQDTFSAQQQRESSILAGYGGLTSQVLGDIQGISASQAQAIQDAYAQQSGQQNQQLLNSGLGNTTIRSSMNRGLTLDEQKAQIALANQTAQLTAGYRSQLGSAGLAFQNQANLQDTALAQAQLNFQNSVSAPYPNVSDYSNLLSQAGFAQQQQLLNNYLGITGGGAALVPAFSGGIGRAPSAPGPAYNPTGQPSTATGAAGNYLVGSLSAPPGAAAGGPLGGSVDTSFLGAVSGAAPTIGGATGGFALGGGAGLAAGIGGAAMGLMATDAGGGYFYDPARGATYNLAGEGFAGSGFAGAYSPQFGYGYGSGEPFGLGYPGGALYGGLPAEYGAYGTGPGGSPFAGSGTGLYTPATTGSAFNVGGGE